MQSPDGPLVVGEYTFESRLFLGTGKYSSNQIMREAHIASGCDCVTVAVRRVDFEDRSDEAFFNHIDLDRYKILPNTAGCFNAVDAVRTLRLAREALGGGLVKLEVLADERTLLPDPIETLAAAETLEVVKAPAHFEAMALAAYGYHRRRSQRIRTEPIPTHWEIAGRARQLARSDNRN